MRTIETVITELQNILSNPTNVAPDMLGSYIVGATIVQDDSDVLFEKYPLLEELAELGADLETLGSSPEALQVLSEINAKLEILSKK
ncbi:MAG: hypothetical protein WAQ27_06495 [Candidatus Microsaccharimonas sp.]